MTEKEESIKDAEAVDYEDDFEKDLDWLINEEGKAQCDGSEEEDDDDIERKIDKELEDEEREESKSSEHVQLTDNFHQENEDLYVKESLYLSDQHATLSELDGEESFLDKVLFGPEEEDDKEDEEAKKYILEKIEQANKQLEDEEPVNESRERRLKFKENLIDFEVPPLEYVELDDDDGINCNDGDISGRMSVMKISNNDEPEISPISIGSAKDQENKDKKVLIERDGKFELLSLQDIESQSFLPVINGGSDDTDSKHSSPRSSHILGFDTKDDSTSFSQDSTGFSSSGSELNYLPRPPTAPKGRPSSAATVGRNARKKTSTRRVQSANLPARRSTYCLTPEQKQLQKKIEQSRAQQRKEEEAIKREEEEQKRQENELAFQAWLQKKKEQLKEERRVQRAKNIELNSCKDQNVRDPSEAFKMWMKKKHEENIREKLVEQMKRQEEENNFLIHEKEECERAFKLWLRRKKAEKRTEQLAAKERTRRLIIEARKARRTQDLLCRIHTANSFRFIDYHGYTF
ncbi:coiled-coil domain-containing protein 181 isoform X2 [Protopterus annectens]|uniref:coiled-coil domain-containing protein 181 isoform X2 n=1 Tax=Protopterus annectens TaxID=7888 RepID=UPI001CF932B9|nr:coiled-coil domain-containing protein 181 isoform X2 [Protopterus annectens]